MNDRQFDNLIKEKLLKHDSTVPTGMWDRIASKQRRPGGWLLRLGMLFFALSLLGTATVWFAPTAPRNTRPHFKREVSTVTGNTAQQNSKLRSVVAHRTKAGHNKTALLLASSHIYEKKEKSNAQKAIKAKQRKFKHETTNLSVSTSTYVDTGLSTGKHNNNANSAQATQQSYITSTPAPDKPTQKPLQAQDPAYKTDTENSSEASHFAVEVFASPDFAFNHISAADKVYEQELKNSMRPGTSYTAGLRFRYMLSKKMHFKIGVQYINVNTKGSYLDSTSRMQSSHNQYRFTGVPLLMGYRTSLPGGVQWSINAGLVVSIRSRYKGIIPLNSGGLADVSKEIVYNTNVHTGLYIGTDFSKPIKNRAEVFLEPWLLKRPKNMAARFYGFEQRIHTIGVSAGIRYRLYNDKQ